MENLIKIESAESPKIELNSDGRLFFRGNSTLPNALDFYSGIIDWISDYYLTPAKKTLVSIHLSEINSSSNNMLQKIFHTLNSLNKTNKTDVSCIWYYDVYNKKQTEFVKHIEKDANTINFILQPRSVEFAS